MSDPSQRVVVVTGASRGIGRSIALSLAAPDHKVYVTYRSKENEATQVCDEISKAGGRACPLALDIGDPVSIEAGFSKVADESGGVDVLVNNAGVSIDGLILRYKDDDWEKIVDINLRGTFLCTKAALKTMIRRKNSGRVVFLTSVVGQMGNTGQSAYAATKAGIVGFMKSIAREVASRGVTANAIAPGFVKTDMTDSLTDAQKTALLGAIPLKRWAEPEEIAKAVQFLVSNDASYITGQVISVNGGMYL